MYHLWHANEKFQKHILYHFELVPRFISNNFKSPTQITKKHCIWWNFSCHYHLSFYLYHFLEKTWWIIMYWTILKWILFICIIQQDVFFPSVIVCNINQIRKSLLRGLGLKNYNDIDLLYRQFYTGMDRNLTSRELDTILSLATSEVR